MSSKEFDEVVEPTKVRKPQQQTEAQEVPRTPEFDKFMGDVSDGYIQTLRNLAPLSEYTLDIDGQKKTFQRRKIRGKEYTEIEELRAKYAKAQKDQEFDIASKTFIEIYKKCAWYYLGMTEEEFDNSDLEETKKVCDACSHRTLYGLPN